MCMHAPRVCISLGAREYVMKLVENNAGGNHTEAGQTSHLVQHRLFLQKRGYVGDLSSENVRIRADGIRE